MANKPFTLGRAQIAYLLGVDDRTLSRWHNREVDPLPVKARGKRGTDNEYDPQIVVRWHVRQKLAEVMPSSAGERLDFSAERARLTKAQADHEELRVGILRGDILPAQIVIELTAGQNAAARSKVLSVPSKLRNRHPEMAQSLVDEITGLLHEALDELSRTGLHDDLRARLAAHLGRLESAVGLDGQ